MKIVVAVDGSKNALRAAEHAVYLAKHLPDAQLEVIHVEDHNHVKSDFLLTESPESLALRRKKKVDPVKELAASAEVDVKVTMLKGTPSRAIIKYVKDHSVDQLVLGSRGLNVFQEMVLGSVSHKVMKHASCPVTIVK